MKSKKFLCLIISAIMLVCCLASCAGESENPFVRGTLVESGWESEWMGLKFTLSDNMTMSTAEEIESMMEIGVDAYFENDFGEKLVDYTKVSAVYEMMAIDEYGNNVIIMAEKLPLKAVSVDTYIENFKDSLAESLVEGIEVSEIENYTLAGQEYSKVSLTYKISGIEISQVCLFRKQEDRMIGILFTEIQKGAFDNIAANFSAFE